MLFFSWVILPLMVLFFFLSIHLCLLISLLKPCKDLTQKEKAGKMVESGPTLGDSQLKTLQKLLPALAVKPGRLIPSLSLRLGRAELQTVPLQSPRHTLFVTSTEK